MRFCQQHWEALRTAIDQRGLTQLVARDGVEAVAKMKADLQTGTTRDTFDPLLLAHNAILKKSIEVLGMEVFQPNADGSPRCPLCFSEELHATDPAHQESHCACGWSVQGVIDGAADWVLEGAKHFGLVGDS